MHHMAADHEGFPRPRKVLIALLDEDFRRLALAAERETRTPDQQAAHIIRRSLRRRSHAADTVQATPRALQA
jgi:hypothetical protein